MIFVIKQKLLQILYLSSNIYLECVIVHKNPHAYDNKFLISGFANEKKYIELFHHGRGNTEGVRKRITVYFLLIELLFEKKLWRICNVLFISKLQRQVTICH